MCCGYVIRKTTIATAVAHTEGRHPRPLHIICPAGEYGRRLHRISFSPRCLVCQSLHLRARHHRASGARNRRWRVGRARRADGWFDFEVQRSRALWGGRRFACSSGFCENKFFTDQLERKGCVSADRIGAIRTSISAAERASGAARNAALTKLSAEMESERGCDSKKVDMLKKALQDLQITVM